MSEDYSLQQVDVSLSPQERFEEFLQSRGKRVTQQRRQIVEEVFSQHEHFDADQLHQRLSGSTEDVSRPTIYRCLKELVEAGLLRTMKLDSRTVFEHDYGYPDHDHLHCERCNKLIEFHSTEMQKLREEVAKQYNFRVAGHRLIINGICEACSRPRRRSRPLEMI